MPRLRPKVVAGLAVVLAVLVGGWLWLRDSSLVAVKRVTVTGVYGPETSQIRAALTAAARHMTTLDVETSKLRRAVSRYPVIKDLDVSTHFPHGMTIRVVEQVPVAVIVTAGHRTAVAGDGILLRDVRPSPSLPAISLRTLPDGSRLTNNQALAAVAVLGAAPYQLLAHVGAVSTNPAHGVVVQLRHGPSLYFGDPTLLGSKWTAAAGVLADPGSTGASYIDVVNPGRPAAGSAGGDSASSSSAATASVGSGAGASPASSASATAASPASAGSPASAAAGATGSTALRAGGSSASGAASSSPNGG